MGFCILSAIIFFILFLYLDQVFPNEWGKKKHPLFFIGYPFNKHATKKNENKNKNDQEDPIEMTNLKEENFEKVDQIYKDKELSNQAVVI